MSRKQQSHETAPTVIVARNPGQNPAGSSSSQ